MFTKSQYIHQFTKSLENSLLAAHPEVPLVLDDSQVFICYKSQYVNPFTKSLEKSVLIAYPGVSVALDDFQVYKSIC